MVKTIFPVIAPPEGAGVAEMQPLCVDGAWDFERDRPLLRGGEPVRVTGAEAVRAWAYNVLRTERYRWDIWSYDYGCELGRLVGQPFGGDTKRAEAVRYITEALTVSPYITGVEVEEMELRDSVLSARVRIETVYGEVELHV